MLIPLAKKEITNETPAVVGKGFIIRVSTVAALGGLLFGFDTAIISGAIPFVKYYFQLNDYLLGWAVGCILIGCCAGALISGFIADKLGRKTMLLICAVLFALSGIGVALSSELNWFVFYRLVGGIGVGSAAMISPIYIAEIAPAVWRGRLVSLYQLAIVSGILLAYFSNYLLANTGANNWRYMFISQCFPAGMFLLMLFSVPETPRWLTSKGRINEALAILTKTIGHHGAQIEVNIIKNSFDSQDINHLYYFSKKYTPVLFIGVWIAVFQQVTGINAVLYYAPLIFKNTGLGTADSLLQTIIIGLVNVAATFIAIGYIDKIGRKLLMLVGCCLMALSLSIVAICFYWNYFDYYVVLIAVLVYVASFSCTLGAVTWVYLSEIFPNRIRAFGMSVATFSLWLADFLVTYTFPFLTSHFGSSLTFALYAFLAIAAFFYILIKLPETKGKSLEQIEKLFIK